MKLWAMLLLLLSACALPALADDKATVPASQAVVDATKLVHDVYKDDYAKRGPDERRALAAKLLDEGKSTTADPGSHYVLLCEARDLAMQVADVDTAMDAVEELGKSFNVNLPDEKLKALTTLRGSAHQVDAHQAGADRAAQLIDDALQADNFDVAGKAADLLVAFATGAKNMQMVALAQARKNEIKAQSTAYLEMKIAADKLKADPKDGPSHYAVGLYEAVFQNDWDRGLAEVANGSDATWASIAKLDLANPVDQGDMLKVADGWYDLAARNPSMKARILTRAEFWYNLIAPSADGIVLQKINRRLDDIATYKPESGGGVSADTRKLLPTPAEMARFKDIAMSFKVNTNRLNELQEFRQEIYMRLAQNNAIYTVSPADYFARCKADSAIRKVLIANGAVQWVNNMEPLIMTFTNFCSNSKDKDDFAARMRAFERYNESEKVLDAASQDNVEFSAVRNYVSRNVNSTLSTTISRVQFCDWLKTKGIKSASIDRYRAQVSRSIY